MTRRRDCDYLIIGSGFGGSFVAMELARAGKDVLVIERGVWPARDDSCWDENVLHFPEPLYRGHTPILADQGGAPVERVWPEDLVGGMSPMYGAAAFRLREQDFLGAPLDGSGARDPAHAWPLTYEELEPYYEEAERLQDVAGVPGEDPSDPPRRSGFPQAPPELSRPSRRVWAAAEGLGLRPARIPLAINFNGRPARSACIRCETCDKFLCRIEAKNDLAVVAVPEVMSRGAEVLSDNRVTRIHTSGRRASSVEVLHQSSGDRWTIRAGHVILSAGALGSPYLLLRSGIQGEGRGSELTGRFLTRHINCVVAGLLPFRNNPERAFHKHVVISDFWNGDPLGRRNPKGPWGIIQEVHIPGPSLLKANTPRGLRTVTAAVRPFLTGLLCIAEDVPQLTNRVFPDAGSVDRFGEPSMRVFHRYCSRDYQAADALADVARRILRRMMALPVHTHPIVTYSHAAGTCRFGKNPETSVLDPECRVWGFENLWVVDGSFMPSCGAVNPSLTIAANALRVGSILARR